MKSGPCDEIVQLQLLYINKIVEKIHAIVKKIHYISTLWQALGNFPGKDAMLHVVGEIEGAFLPVSSSLMACHQVFTDMLWHHRTRQLDVQRRRVQVDLEMEGAVVRWSFLLSLSWARLWDVTIWYWGIPLLQLVGCKWKGARLSSM